MAKEKESKFVKNGCYVTLKKMGRQIKYLFCSMNWVSNDYDFWDIIRLGGLVDTVSDGKKFNLYASNIYHIVKSFDNEFIVNMSMWDRSSDVVLYTSICNNKSIEGNIWRFNSQIIKLLNLGFEIIVVIFTKPIKRETTRENVNNSMSRKKFRVKRIKGRKYFIEMIVHINYWFFD